MSAVRNLITKFTKNTVNDTGATTDDSPPEKSSENGGIYSSALSLPDCAPPDILISRTVEFFLRPHIEDTSCQLTNKESPTEGSEPTENGDTNPLNQQEVTPPAPNPSTSAPTPDSSPYAGNHSQPAISADTTSTPHQSQALDLSGSANNPSSQDAQQGRTNDKLAEDNSRTKARAKVSILSQDIQPQRILSINVTLFSAESTTPPETQAANNTNEAAQEPQESQMIAFDLKYSIRDVLGNSQCEVQDLDALEITGSPECFPFIQEILREVLKNTPRERFKFSWDKLGDTDAGYREVFLKDQLSSTTQVLILRRQSDFSINLHCGPSTDDESPNIAWYITGLDDKLPPATVKLVYQLHPSGYCDIDPVCTIIGPSGPTEQETSADKTFIDQKKLDVRYSLIRSSHITAHDLLLLPVDVPELLDETSDQPLPLPHLGGTKIMGIPSCIVVTPQTCVSILCMAKVTLIEMSKTNIFVSTLLTVVVIVETALICIPHLQYRFPRPYYNPRYALVAASVGFCMTLAPQICATFFPIKGGAAIAMLCVGFADAAFCGICAIILSKLDKQYSNIAYSDYIELGAVLEAESHFPKFFADSDKPRQSKTLKKCLEHYRTSNILRLLKTHDTDKNQTFWREMGILRRIPYALMPGWNNCPDELSLKCLRVDMTRAEAFQFVVIRKRILCKRLGISIVDTDKEIQRRFSLIRDPDSRLVLI